MKKVFILAGLLVISHYGYSQKTQDYQKQIEEAQKELKKLQSDPKVSQAIKQANQEMNDLKKEKSGVNVPNGSGNNLPDFNNMQATLDNASQFMQNNAQAMYAGTPKPDPTHHADKLPVLNEISLLKETNGLLKTLATTIGSLEIQKLNVLIKNPAINIAGTGTLYLSLGFSTDTSGYLIAKGVLKQPSDPYAANGLGVYYRDKNRIVQALQCFFYADNLLPDSIKSPYIYTNIGWASFYYGDFNTAEKYFDKALAISEYFEPAMEGQATLAYANGDTKTLFECLAKELLSMTKTAGGPGGMGSGPSSAFTATCGGAFSQEQESNENGQQGSTQSSPFDNIGTEDNSPEQDPPQGADVTFPLLFKPVFINNVTDDLAGAFAQIISAESKATDIISALRNRQKGLNPRYFGLPYFDEHGDLMHDRDYTKFLNLHGLICLQLESWVQKNVNDFGKFEDDFYNKVSNRALDLGNQLNTKLQACGGDNEQSCEAGVYCEMIPKFIKEGNNFLAISAEHWEKMYDAITKDLNWFLRNDAAFVSRVHDTKCNEDLNLDREIEVRNSILSAYDCWKSVLSPLITYSNFAHIKHDKCPSVEMGVMGNGADPFSKRPKHIKEFADKNSKDMVFQLGILGSITENSHFTKITIGPKIGPLQLGFSYTTNKDLLTGKVKDQIYSTNNNFDHSYGGTIGLSYKVDDIVDFGGSLGGSVSYGQNGTATGYTGSTEAAGDIDFGFAKLGGKASRTWQFDSEGNITGYNNSVTGSASLGGNAPINAGNAGIGSSVNGEYNSTRNYDANGNYIGGTNSATLSGQLSATSNAGEANSEVSSQNNIFALQYNQVIQVVAGQEQSSQWINPDNK